MDKLAKLMKKLALLNRRCDAAEEAVKVEANAEAKKLKLAEVTSMIDEIEALNDEVAIEETAVAASAAANREEILKTPKKSQTIEGGDLGDKPLAGSMKDNIYKDKKLGFKNYGDVAMAVYKAATNGGYDERLKVIAYDNIQLQAEGLRQGVGPEGGYLVPAGVRSADLSNEQGLSLNLYSLTNNFTLGQEISVEIPAVNEKSRKDGLMYGGVQANWTEEEAQIPQSEPSFRQILLKPKELTALITVSNTLLRNSPVALGQFLDMASNDVINFKLSDAVMNGDGAGKPKGWMESDALITLAKETGQTAETVVVENTLKMVAKMSLRWRAGAVWLINTEVMAQLQLFTIGDKPVFIPGGTVAGQPFATLHGFPIMETEYNEVLGTKGDIQFVNLRAYLTAQHGGGVMSDESRHFFFDTNKTAFKFITDADGQTWMKQPVINFKGNGTTSAFVTLATRS